MLQFILTRVRRAAFQAGQSERLLQALVGQDRSDTNCRVKSSLWCFMTVQYVCRYLGLEIYTHTHMLNYTSYVCIGVCIGACDGILHFQCKKIKTLVDNLSAEMGTLHASKSLFLNLSVLFCNLGRV